VLLDIDYQVRRVCAELASGPGWVGFADIGWNDKHGGGSHPIHVIHYQGEVEIYNDRWTVFDQNNREFVFKLIKPGGHGIDQWAQWLVERDRQNQPYNAQVAISQIVELAQGPF